MALSYNQDLGDGVTTNYSLDFEYLSRSHVYVSVDGEEVPYTWLDTYTVQVIPAPASGSVVERRRRTPRVERLVKFEDGSTLVATDLNVSTLQSFFLAQEAFDEGEASMAVTEDGMYSAQTRRITNLGDPVDPQDAVTKEYHDGTFLPQMNSLLSATQTARTEAQTARTGSETARSEAQTARTAAQTARSEAQTAKTAAETARDDSQTAKTAAETARSDAQAARSDAQAARDSASGHRLNAYNAQVASEAARDASITAKDTSVTARTGSEAARDTAETYRNQALTYRNQAEAFAAASDSTARLSKVANLSDLSDILTARANLKLWTGSQAAYNAIGTKDPQTIYFIT